MQRFKAVTWQFPSLIATATDLEREFAARRWAALFVFCPPSSPFSQHILWFLYSTSTIFSISFTSTSFILYSTQSGTLVLFQVLQSKLCCVVPPTHTAHLRLFSHRSGSLLWVQKTIWVFSPKNMQPFIAGLTYIPFYLFPWLLYHCITYLSLLTRPCHILFRLHRTTLNWFYCIPPDSVLLNSGDHSSLNSTRIYSPQNGNLAEQPAKLYSTGFWQESQGEGKDLITITVE